MEQRRILAAAVGLAVLAGCTRYDVRVTSYRAANLEMPEPGGPARIAVVAETRPPEPLLDRELVRKIERLLHTHGYETGSVDEAEYVLAAFAAVDSGRRVVDWYENYYPGMHRTTTIYTGRGRRTYVRTYDPGYYVARPYTYTSYTRFLSLTLSDVARLPEEADASSDRAARAIVWRSTAGSVGESNDLRRVVDVLLVASWEYFGADTGRQVREKVSDADERVKALRAAAAAHSHGATKRLSHEDQD